jgi:hypothetical protein
MIEARGNTESAIDARIVFCRHSRNSLGFQKGDELVTPGIEKDVPQSSALFDLYRVTGNRFESENAFVKLTGLVQIQCRQPDV